MEKQRGLLELSELKAYSWTSEELWHHHRVLSDVSPWLNAQGNAIHHQVINEIKRRNDETKTF
jgi:hypothetical protein